MLKHTKIPTAQDVARAAGVSQATVSYILSGRRSGRARISAATRERVLAAAAELNYVPNHTARSLRRQRTERICVVLQDIGVPFDEALVRDVQRVADRRHYTVIVAVAGSAERERQVFEQLRRRLADGAIWITPNHLSAEDLSGLADLNLAIVTLSNHLTGRGFDTIRTIDRAASRKAVEYLLSRGHRRIAFLGHCADEQARLERLEGYRDALDAHGLEPDERLMRGSDNLREHAYHNAKLLLQMDGAPTAIFAASDMAAISALWAARDCGLRVPEDVAIVGTGNIPEGRITNPPLSTVGSDSVDFAFFADLLFSRLDGDAPSEGRVIPDRSALILRGSA
jgi:LacI family transcriptional regulator